MKLVSIEERSIMRPGLKSDGLTGMKLHLYCILPAGILVCFQFVPAIRHNIILLHRVNGYFVITLSLISSAGVLIVARQAFGGDFSTQTYVGLLVILTTLGYLMAWINIKLLQIDQHRAWMMRTWTWVGLTSLARNWNHSDLSIVCNDYHNPHNPDHCCSGCQRCSRLVSPSRSRIQPLGRVNRINHLHRVGPTNHSMEAYGAS
jgi:uncharacterized membrane protein